jgi:cryptochrome
MVLYPKPMFDFNERRQFCLDKMKAAYDKKLYGDDEKVMNGKWKTVFGFQDGGGDRHSKRSREEEGSDDDGVDADVGDATDDVPPKKAAKKGSTGKKSQGTLDNMVTRKKGA